MEEHVESYSARFAVGDVVCVVGLESLEGFRRPRWPYHHPIEPDKLELAGTGATIASVGYYHGGEALYELEVLPGVWHEATLAGVNDTNV
jgi:hypothetical protein